MIWLKLAVLWRPFDVEPVLLDSWNKLGQLNVLLVLLSDQFDDLDGLFVENLDLLSVVFLQGSNLAFHRVRNFLHRSISFFLQLLQSQVKICIYRLETLSSLISKLFQSSRVLCLFRLNAGIVSCRDIFNDRLDVV